MIVIDANVAAKWYLPEEGSPKALALLRNPAQLIAPSLIRMEVCAAITRRSRTKEIPAAEAGVHCEAWFADLCEDAVQMVPEDEILARAIELSLGISHNLQDCLYLAVAEMRGIPLVTADEPFHKRAKSMYPDVHLLSKWKLH